MRVRRHAAFGLALLLLTAALYWGAYLVPLEFGLPAWLWSPIRVRNGEWLPRWSGVFFHVAARVCYALAAVWLARVLLRLRPPHPVRVGAWVLAASLVYFLIVNIEFVVVLLPGSIADVFWEARALERPAIMKLYTRGGLGRLLPLVVLSHAAITYGLVLLAGRARSSHSTAASAGLATTT
jgi:hypothetical protein